MIIRAVDINNDWLYGTGLNNYASGNAAVAFLINYRLRCFLADCYFDQADGMDWFNLLGSKDLTQLSLAVRARILNTANVVGIQKISITVDRVSRAVVFEYTVTTTYSAVTGTVNFSANAA